MQNWIWLQSFVVAFAIVGAYWLVSIAWETLMKVLREICDEIRSLNKLVQYQAKRQAGQGLPELHDQLRYMGNVLARMAGGRSE